MVKPAPNSIKRTLVLRMMIPLGALTILAGIAAYALASHFTKVVLDEWLYDSAIALANRVHMVDGEVVIDLPRGAREIVEWDVVDRVFYEVITGSGERLSGNAVIPDPPTPLRPGRAYRYYEGVVQNAAVRILVTRVELPDSKSVAVKVAETRNKHNALALQMQWISVALTLFITIICSFLVWAGVRSGISSMERAVDAAGERQVVAPLQPIIIGEDMPLEMHPLVDAINRLIGDLAAAHGLNQRFIADAAHQLRTPLATLRVQLDMARRERDPERHAAALEDAVNALTRMNHMLHQLLTLAKVDHAAMEGGATTDLVEMARQEVERYFEKAAARGIDLGYAGGSEPIVVHGRIELLREALGNLIENAIEYGGRDGRVTVGVAAATAEIYVEDSGPGISMTELPKVRDRFYRVPGSAGDGCGLGLSIVEEITRQCGGELILETGPEGRGLRAKMRFSGATREPLT